MAHVRKDTRVASPEWWKHLRPYNKRKVSKAERRAAKCEITEEMLGMNDLPSERFVEKMGLHNSRRAMEKLMAEKGEMVIPPGMYCYDGLGNCPYWDKSDTAKEQNNGYCWFMRRGDWNENVDLLWDQCKCCGKREEEAPDGTMEVGG